MSIEEIQNEVANDYEKIIAKHVARIIKLESENSELKTELDAEIQISKKGFSEGIEAAKELLWKERFSSKHCVASLVEELDKLKK